METPVEIPLCPLPEDGTSDVLPMLIVIGLFLAAGWGFRYWRRKSDRKQTRR